MGTSAFSATRTINPRRLTSNGTNLIAAETNNNRISIWNTFPTTNGPTIDIVLGQATFTSGGVNAGSTVAATTLNVPNSVQILNGNLWVGDNGNSRFLKYTGIPTVTNTAASFVLGQERITKNNQALSAGTNAHSFNRFADVEMVGNRFFTLSRGNYRMLVYNTPWPAGGLADADYAWGQADMISDQSNRGTTLTSTSLSDSRFVTSVGGKFFISDYANNRIFQFSMHHRLQIQPCLILF